MNRNKILIVTHSKDNQSIDVVSNKLREQGFIPVRFNTDLFPTQVIIESHQSISGQHSVLITEQGERVHSDEIYSVWYRRFYPAKGLPKTMDIRLRQPAVEESKRTILGYLDGLQAKKVDDYWHIRHASNKEYQLMLARRVGLTLPNTLTTNSPTAVSAFYDDNAGDIITKMQTAFSVWEEGKEQVVFTNRVTEAHLNELEQLNLCPMVFQQHIEKEVEVRATVVGERVFSAAIDPSIMAGMETDWRKRGFHTLDKWQPHELPPAVADKLVALAKQLNLHYGAADLIVTTTGEYHFLEINPCGEFYWMDHFHNIGICSAIADELTRPQTV